MQEPDATGAERGKKMLAELGSVDVNLLSMRDVNWLIFSRKSPLPFFTPHAENIFFPLKIMVTRG